MLANKTIVTVMCEKLSHYAPILFISSVLFSTLISQNVLAVSAEQDKTETSPPINLCPVESEAATKYTPPRAFATENRENTEISADKTQSSSDGSISLDGNVIVERDLLRVTADHVDYNKQKNTLHFSGNVHIDTESLSLGMYSFFTTGVFKMGGTG